MIDSVHQTNPPNQFTPGERRHVVCIQACSPRQPTMLEKAHVRFSCHILSQANRPCTREEAQLACRCRNVAFCSQNCRPEDKIPPCI